MPSVGHGPLFVGGKMRKFCYKCRSCGFTFEAPADQQSFHISCCSRMNIIRDYKAEAVSVDAAVGSIQRDFASDERRNLFLPTRKDFERPGRTDREVDAAVKEWNERHENPTKGSGKYRPK